MHRGLWLILLALFACKSATDTGRADRQTASHRPRDKKETCIPTPDESPSTGNRSGKMVMHPRDTRQRAIGSTKKLSMQLQRVFDPAGFVPLARPGPHDWLANHPEPGQTYEQFLATDPNIPDKRRRYIDLLVLGRFSPKSNPSPPILAEYATTFLGIESRLLKPVRLSELSATSRANPHTSKRQIYTPDILDALRKRIAKDAFCLQAVTMEDLYPDPTWNFVFGQASLTDRVGVYSFARYDPAFSDEPRDEDYRKRLLRRSLKVMVHEIGHMFGLLHCVYFRCVMNGSNHLAEADARPMHLCPVCLRKLHQSVGFDPVVRYQRLEAFYRRHKFAAEADFVALRAKCAQK
jgi:archaemetzincin